MPISLDLIGVITRDLGRSLAFYRLLGIDIPAADGTEPHFEIVLPGGMRLAWDTLDTVRSFDESFAPGDGGHPLSLAFRLDGPAEVDATYNRVAEEFGGHIEPWDAVWGQRYAILHDPDGNTVDLFAPLP